MVGVATEKAADDRLHVAGARADGAKAEAGVRVELPRLGGARRALGAFRAVERPLAVAAAAVHAWVPLLAAARERVEARLTGPVAAAVSGPRPPYLMLLQVQDSVVGVVHVAQLWP